MLTATIVRTSALIITNFHTSDTDPISVGQSSNVYSTHTIAAPPLYAITHVGHNADSALQIVPHGKPPTNMTDWGEGWGRGSEQLRGGLRMLLAKSALVNSVKIEQ